jgi:L-ascorbate metabolism protein UlaG (beta-lactamase superfamily)
MRQLSKQMSDQGNTGHPGDRSRRNPFSPKPDITDFIKSTVTIIESGFYGLQQNHFSGRKTKMKTRPRINTAFAVVGLAMAAGILAATGICAYGAEESPSELARMTSNIHWLGHDSFRIDGDGQVIYIDPYKTAGGAKADLILITHDHADHASPEDVATIRRSDTIIVAPSAAAAKFSDQVQIVKPGDKLDIRGISIEAVPAYNVNKFRSPGVPFHPRDSGHVGYIVTVKGTRIYHAGDTDAIPEMQSVHCDVALLPVSGIYVMTAEEAASAAAMIHTRVVIPMHVGKGIGSLKDAERFKTLSTVPTVILKVE